MAPNVRFDMHPEAHALARLTRDAVYIAGDEWWIDGCAVSASRGCRHCPADGPLRRLHDAAARACQFERDHPDPFDFDSSHEGLRRGRPPKPDVLDGLYAAGDR